jgi:DNA-binding HxlR family transcriptional regulator
MKRKRFEDSSCPIARTLDIVGEWWTLLIVRDALLGARRFEEFRRSGIADNILSSRLDLLVRENIFDRRQYQEHPPRYEYALTDKGSDLLPVVVALGRWGLRWTDVDGSPPELIHRSCGSEIGPDLFCESCARRAAPAEVQLTRASDRNSQGCAGEESGRREVWLASS